MRADPKTYENVAKNCSQFAPLNSNETYMNSAVESSNVSCVNCEHFTAESYCDIDLYDKIVKNL